MGAPADSEPELTSSETGTAGSAGLGPGQRSVVAGRYRLVEHIADGGMGSVYVAEHVLSKKKLALKVVFPYLCKGRQGVERFRREVSAAAEIDHPGIVQVYDAGVDDDGGFFMAMELLAGESLGDRLRRDWPGMKSAVQLVEEMLEPLAKAHAKGFVHRDLKPDNIFLAKEEGGGTRVKILDFGLAREVSKGGPTRTGITFGTPEYMSPEQAMSARKVRSPGDVWSVGVMLYELLSGMHPFDGETPNAIMANAIKEPLPPLRDHAPHVPEPLAALVERSLEKEPAARPQTAGELLEELRAVLAGLTLDETVPSAPQPPEKWGDEEDEPGIAVSSELPVQRQSKVKTEIVVDVEEYERRPSRSRLPLVIGGFVVLALAVAGAAAWLASEPSAPSGTASLAESRTAAPEVPDVPVATPDLATPEVADPTEAEVDLEPPVAAPVAAAAEAAVESPSEAGAGSRPSSRRHRAEPHPAVEETEPEAAAGPSALDEARACMARGDNNCARQALEGRARSAAELALLVDLYRSSGRMSNALDTMERFVARYPTAPQAGDYRADLARYRGN